MKRNELPALLRRHGATLYLLLIVLLVAVELFFFYHEVSPQTSRRIWVAVALIDTIVLVTPYWWLPRRWRWAVLVLVWILSVFYVGNLVYMRFWGRLMPLTLLNQAGNTNDVLVDSILGMLRPSDMLYLVVPVVVTLIWCMRPLRGIVKAQSYSVRERIIATVFVIVVFFVGQYIMSKDKTTTFMRQTSAYEILVRKVDAFRHPSPDTKSYFCTFGQNIYLLYQLGSLPASSAIELSASEKEGLMDYCALADLQKNMIAENIGKNLIFIIVESLNADMVNFRINGREVTPYLNALAQSPQSITSLHVRPQIVGGNSADGQLMYNIGLLPTRIYVGGSDFVPYLDHLPGLGYIFGNKMDCAAVFADPGDGWNKMKAYKKYGYDRIYNSDSIRAHTPAGMSRDGAMFQYALERVDSMARPFHLQLLTIQMHGPCNEPVKDFTNYTGTGLYRSEQLYINCTADFDRHLGEFIRGLKKRGVWENTVLVIASDHCVPNSVRADGEPADIVFIAANAGRGERIEQEVHQVDVFPTVLDIMGVEGGWRGVGRSMLGPRRGESDARQAGVSDSLLRSDYFK